MIATILQISFRRLMHNRVELMLTFLVPVAFFSIFAVIFGGGIGGSGTPRIKVVAVDEINVPASQSIITSLRSSTSLRFMRDQTADALNRQQAEDIVRRGSAAMAVVLSNQSGRITPVLLADSSDQVASQVVAAVVLKTVLHQGPTGSTFAPDAVSPNPNQTDARSAVARPTHSPASIEIVDVMGEGKSNPVVSMYAAGIAVMFLLFGASSGGGALLEEYESQTLDRLLSTQMTMDQLLLGKWFYLTLVGIVQVSVMFAWGQLVFGIDLVGHLDGFAMMTLVTASAAAAFGLFLATLCRTRGQLNGLSTVLILTMSALGGSMVPRYVMSEKVREMGMWTFNAWALDGYDKVFWRELPVRDLAPQLAVLMISGVAFLLTARVLATRWECD
ncbi:ABC transporter permease [Planctomycetes bacterium K23_9]|uniref:ABC-2 family transporter protein n=1 Tax=Stieleria marina TaxID=1930275 RepID=A0A517P0W5_9BACT|nr:ABC-2 family transporter protein [Planctomycetes bacterium K23_9]